MSDSSDSKNLPHKMPVDSCEPPETGPLIRPLLRFMIWVDGVGGFMVCADTMNTIGQSIQQNDVSIPICGDLQSLHAKIQSVESGHLLHPVGPISIEQQSIDEPKLLSSDRTFELGDSVSLRYCKPHPWSSTAVISFESRNRTYPWSDAVLIAGETIILGSNPQSHIRCSWWEHEIILIRRDCELFCRSFAEFTIDGESIELEGNLKAGSRVEGQDFSFSIEALN